MNVLFMLLSVEFLLFLFLFLVFFEWLGVESSVQGFLYSHQRDNMVDSTCFRRRNIIA